MYVSIDECIHSYLDESEQPISKYYKCFQLAFRAMTELGLDFFYQIQSVKLPVNSNKTVNLPENYLNYSKIGVLNDVGEIIPLSYNSKLTNYADLHSDRISKVEDPQLFDFVQWNTPIWYNYWNGDAFTNLYGLPSGEPFVGSFKIDVQNNVIVLNPDFAYNYLMVEYIASPQEDGDYYVPIQFKEAVIAYIAWKDVRGIPSKTHVNNANVQMRRKDFYNERRLANARYKPLYLTEAYEWSLKNQRSTVKA